MKQTNRGFALHAFTDRNGGMCSLQKSSLATEDCIWLGHDEIGLKKFTPGEGWTDVPLQQDHPYGVTHIANTRMHLNRAQVRELLPMLQAFVATGELSERPPEDSDKPMALNDRETATVLHALRMYQEDLRTDGHIEDLPDGCCSRGECDHFDESGGLSEEDTDKLCDRLNNFDVAAKPPQRASDDALDVLRYLTKNCTAQSYSPWAAALGMANECLLNQPAPAPRRVVVVLETGLVRDVFATHPIDVAIIEMVNDTDVEPSELKQIPLEEDSDEEEMVDAVCSIEEPIISPTRTNQLYEIAAKE